MIFNKREYLSVLQIRDDAKEVSFDVLKELLYEQPSNIIYCEKNNKLYGIISMGDIHRAKGEEKRCVEINTVFTYLQGFEYMKARKIFLEKEKINALPIVDDEHRLIGEYSRWDDAFFGYRFNFLKGKQYTNIIWEKYKNIAIVKPSMSLAKKQRILEKWAHFFKEMGIEVELISKKDILEALNSKDMVLFTDEDESRGIETFYKDILNKDFRRTKVRTLETLEEIMDEAMVETVLRNIRDSGVHVITLQVNQNDGDYWKYVQNEIKTKFQRIGLEGDCAVHEEFWEDFYDDKYDYNYASDIGTQNYPQIVVDGSLKLEDFQGKYYNVVNGERLTVGQPSKYNNNIYFYGPCLVVGWRVEDADTIESQLQEMFNEREVPSRVVNCGCWSSELQLLMRMCSTTFKRGDIAIVYDKGKAFTGIPTINLAEVLERNNIPAEWYWNHPTHPNHKVNKLWAKEIYKCISKFLQKDITTGQIDKCDDKYSLMLSFYKERYFGGFKMEGRIGAIVMNCNPFTYGHRYLIEQAYEKVDRLIIFVVEENKSLFSFRERFAMVCEGTKDLKNLIVVPSGQFILSQQTFPEYFLKVENDDVKQNAEYDILLFAKGIAPKLNIKYRFVGEEKDDPVTRKYNEAMKKILPEYGIEVVEIPRKTERNGKPIRATNVRLLLEHGKVDEIGVIVPDSTKKMLMMSWD